MLTDMALFYNKKTRFIRQFYVSLYFQLNYNLIIKAKGGTIMGTSYIELIVRLSLAFVLGGMIGLEREYRAKEAGFRTHFLVALGSALFCVVSQFGFGIDLKDSSRVAAQVVSGIGFLGAGTIIFQKKRCARTHYGCWTMGDGCHRTGVRNRYVYGCHYRNSNDAARTGGDKRYDTAARHHNHRNLFLRLVDRAG